MLKQTHVISNHFPIDVRESSWPCNSQMLHLQTKNAQDTISKTVKKIEGILKFQKVVFAMK